MSDPNFYPGQLPAEYLARLNLLMGAGDAASQAIENAGLAAAAADAAAGSATAAGEAAALAEQKADQAGAAATATGESATAAGQAAALAGSKADQAAAAANAAEVARNGLVPQTPLSITITGEWSQPPVIIQTPATTVQIGDTLLTNLRTVAQIGYAEVPGANTLTSVSFNDVECVSGAGGAVSGTFRPQVLDMSSAAALTHVGLPSLKILFGDISLPTSVTSLNLTSLIAAISRTGLYIPLGVKSIDLSSLKYAQQLNVTASIQTLSLPLLENTSLVFANADAITTLSMPSIKRLWLQVGGSQAALSNVSLGPTLLHCGSNVVFSSSPLTQASVDNILIRLAALDGTAGTTVYGTGKTVTLSGPSAAPSAAGLAAKAALVARGVTVTTN